MKQFPSTIRTPRGRMLRQHVDCAEAALQAQPDWVARSIMAIESGVREPTACSKPIFECDEADR